eukprot:CAMPEP_0169448424 /NCGR_PEP_ID=MMETSP1042-20121227/12032_1 /TAXON_ID=464988 /ORGANISM="Hemiselmis andersenii, Strain CCMP1180" /LENGTH=75 /DNA_ID=CAMNT_0009560019 /DNA_START=33 /DNA_END=257 /DNA_ORIENTATION=+
MVRICGRGAGVSAGATDASASRHRRVGLSAALRNGASHPPPPQEPLRVPAPCPPLPPLQVPGLAALAAAELEVVL